ncbi:hypothetical protein [Aquitalea sp.]|uniref:hypothetical protein n=1 Tax=Aquitalea sp. TaxID=1872623 RepID=UPI00258BA075|nr:hypothetical protein [Aquitalea sp.]
MSFSPLQSDAANMQTQHSLVLLSLLSALLTACQSVGVQYRFPTAMEPSAELQGKEGGMIDTFDAEGCYVGRTSVTDKVRLRAGDPVVLAYEVVLNASTYNTIYNVPPITCTRLFSFIPQANARYVLRGDIRYVNGKNLFGKTIAIPSCEAGLKQRLQDGAFIDVPVTYLGLQRKRWNCLQASPLLDNPP